MTKLIRNIILGIGFTVLSSNVVLASEGGGVSAVVPPELSIEATNIEESKDEVLAAVAVDAPREADEETYKKQREIDSYLFEEHAEEISKLDFKVTHTGSVEEYVEIGISPFNEENAQYLYDLFGKDAIKVVEGEQAQLYTTPVDTEAIEAETISAEEASETKPNNFLLYGVSLIVILGGLMIVGRKLKSAK